MGIGVRGEIGLDLGQEHVFNVGLGMLLLYTSYGYIALVLTSFGYDVHIMQEGHRFAKGTEHVEEKIYVSGNGNGNAITIYNNIPARQYIRYHFFSI